jgi:hypothetical protein
MTTLQDALSTSIGHVKGVTYHRPTQDWTITQDCPLCGHKVRMAFGKGRLVEFGHYSTEAHEACPVVRYWTGLPLAEQRLTTDYADLLDRVEMGYRARKADEERRQRAEAIALGRKPRTTTAAATIGGEF